MTHSKKKSELNVLRLRDELCENPDVVQQTLSVRNTLGAALAWAQVFE
jgi:hypothetical protein